MAYGKIDPRIVEGVDRGFPGQGPPLRQAFERIEKLEAQLILLQRRIDDMSAARQIVSEPGN